jgi:hypothetical protein
VGDALGAELLCEARDELGPRGGLIGAQMQPRAIQCRRALGIGGGDEHCCHRGGDVVCKGDAERHGAPEAAVAARLDGGADGPTTHLVRVRVLGQGQG